MRLRPPLTLLAVVAALLAALVAAPGGFPASATVYASRAGPLDLSGEINGAPYRLVVPADWNGTLLVFAHGYRDKADHPGEVDLRTAPLALTTTPGHEAALLAHGYALAGSAYKDNGWAVKEALADTVALTSFFRDTVAMPEHTLLWGPSMGSVVTMALAERSGGLFDGYLPVCAAGAGTPRAADGLAALMLAYDVAFGAPASWGPAGDVRDDLDFESEVAPRLVGQVSNPLDFGRFEFVRLVAGVPGSGITPPAPPSFYPGWLFTDMFFATEAFAELERRAGGPIAQNLTHTYRLTSAERAYLALLGVDADPLLAAMNARRTISGPPSARNYAEQYADFSGKIKKPVLTLHTAIDELAPVTHESAYRRTVEAAGRGDLLVQAYTNGVGHCRFTPAQMVTGVGALDDWVKTGTPPSPASFPAALGFVPGFVPPAWPQP